MSSFTSRLELFLQQATVRNTASFRDALARTLVEVIGPNITVDSASARVGAPFSNAGTGNVSFTPVSLEATYSGVSFNPSADESARSLARAFVQTHSIQSASGYTYDGAAIVAAAMSSPRIVRGVRVTANTTIPSSPGRTPVVATPADVPVVQTVVEPATGDTVTTTTTPVVGTATARRQVTRRSSTTGQTVASPAEIVPFVKAGLAVDPGSRGGPMPTSSNRTLWILGGVALVAGAYFYATSRPSRGGSRARYVY